jgi:hypothetical protein
MKKKQRPKLLTPLELGKALCRNPEFQKHRMAMANMDSLFRSFYGFVSDSWMWSKRIKHVEEWKGSGMKARPIQFIEVEYLINGFCKMRYRIKLGVKKPHEHYIVHFIDTPRTSFGGGHRVFTYLDLRDYFRKEIAMFVVSKSKPIFCFS